MSRPSCLVVRVRLLPVRTGTSTGVAKGVEAAYIPNHVVIVKDGFVKDGGLAAHIPVGAKLPEWLLKNLGFWDDHLGKGELGGPDGNIVQEVRLHDYVSQGLLIPASRYTRSGFAVFDWPPNPADLVCSVACEGSNIARDLGLT